MLFSPGVQLLISMFANTKNIRHQSSKSFRPLRRLAGKPRPADRKVDGIDVPGLWMGEALGPIRTEFVHYTSRGDLGGVRQENWKPLVKKLRVPQNRKSARVTTSTGSVTRRR